MINVANSLASQLKIIADEVRLKISEIYQNLYVGDLNFFAAPYVDPVSKTRVMWYLFEDTDENNAGRLSTIVTTASDFGSSAHMWVNGELVFSRVDNVSMHAALIAHLLLTTQARQQLITDNDYPPNTFKTYVSNTQTLQSFVLMSGVGFDLMNGMPFDLMRAS